MLDINVVISTRKYQSFATVDKTNNIAGAIKSRCTCTYRSFTYLGGKNSTHTQIPKSPSAPRTATIRSSANPMRHSKRPFFRCEINKSSVHCRSFVNATLVHILNPRMENATIFSTFFCCCHFYFIFRMSIRVHMVEPKTY